MVKLAASLFGTPTSFVLYRLLENVAALLSVSKFMLMLRGYVFLTNGGMKRADAERFKLYTGLSRHVLYRVL